MIRHVEVRPGAYADSVALMLATRSVEERDGVRGALLAMATPLNLQQLADAGFDRPPDASPEDLLVAVAAEDRAALDAALAGVDDALRRGAPAEVGGRAEDPPRTVGIAARRGPGSSGGVALISVPGEHAVTEALDAISAGLHPMIFSDHVSVQHEVMLKDVAAARGLLVMGPDCGTAVLNGIGLGFANVIAPGPVGIVAASGTGAQQLCCLLDDAGIGVRHVLGVGGRDLSDAVAARSTLTAMRLLDDDGATEVIVVVAKPPAPAVAAEVRALAERIRTPVVTGFVGEAGTDLSATAATAARRLGVSAGPPRRWVPRAAQHPRRGLLRGLFAGGTLCAEAAAIAADALGPVGEDPDADGHVCVDLGADRYTAGRPHPMIDQSLRVDAIQRTAERPGSHVLLLDVVLGHAAHPDPAAELVPALRRARQTAASRGEDLAVVVSLCGAARDPQDRERQADALVDAGAALFAANADAARAAVTLLETGP